MDGQLSKVFDGKRVRIIDRSGELWFVLKDVCDALGINNSRMVADRLEDDEKNTVSLTDGNRGNPNTTLVNESGLYAVILRSDKPEAARFRKWITSEVLPSIRKHGEYAVDQDNAKKYIKTAYSAAYIRETRLTLGKEAAARLLLGEPEHVPATRQLTLPAPVMEWPEGIPPQLQRQLFAICVNGLKKEAQKNRERKMPGLF